MGLNSPVLDIHVYVELYNSQKLRIWDIEPNNYVNISTTSQATNLILIGHRALKKTSLVVKKGKNPPKWTYM